MEHFSISSTVKRYPKLPYQHIKERILGTSYDLSLVFIGERRARVLNEENRKKDYTPNVLSFPLDKKSGEIYICPAVAKRQASKHELTYTQFVGLLFIHGLLHLKGHDHGQRMEAMEQRLLTELILNQQ